jgi:mannose-6-phosphate isomerase
MAGKMAMSTIREPLHLTPLLVPKPWGARRLERFGRSLPPETPIGESWEVADLAGAGASELEATSTLVATGPFAGSTLADLIRIDPQALLGAAEPVDGRFPLLVKLLDVQQPLSVQVHPSAAYVERHPDAAVKTESWVVLDADPEARIHLGWAEGITLDDVRGALGTPQLISLMHQVPAEVGTVHHLPAGTIHTVGGGVLLAEVQTPSDTTFRLYDWTEELGRPPRTLHLEEGMEALALAQDDAAGPGSPASAGGVALPLTTPHYRLDEGHLDVEEALEVAPGTLRVLMVVEGEVDGDGFAWPVAAGASVVLPAAWSGRLRARAETTRWLEATVPDAAV